ncbi:YkgJ family cysteine cluster protein [Candidatus Woesearchaeota archaeon]|nr:YkgJ family cysteine cluster protein [Candidatus Woesearchaeota archaeon]
MRITKDTSLEEVKNMGDKCGRCGRCCSYGSGFMFESEIPRIAAFLNIPKDKFVKEFLEETEIFHTRLFKIRPFKKEGKPYGPCMFLDGKLCRIHDVKPLHCSIGNCGEHGDDLHVWFMLNYCLNIYDPESVRQYVSYVKTGGRMIPGGEVEMLFPDKAVLRSILSYERFR